MLGYFIRVGSKGSCIKNEQGMIQRYQILKVEG